MPTQHVDRETFLARLRDSNLLSTEDLDRAVELAADAEQAKSIARLLVKNGLLTRFQAEMVYRGRTDGFILGQYRVLDELGRGGMGRVFKAEHQTMNRIVALKVVAASLMKTERARKLFQREVRAAARLIHPNIVTAYDANHVGDRHYLVMEFVNGPNLQDLVKERGPLSVGQACDFIRQAAIGLQYAHEMGMVHRDIKPSNLLAQRSPGKPCVIKILDFGLARLHEPKDASRKLQDSLPGYEQQVMGTPDYLSPEQARNLHSADIRSDLYSLGCTMHYLLTGQVPFPGGTALEKLVRHGSDAPAPVHELRPDVPPDVSAIVTKLLAKKPGDRYQTPLELAAELTPLAMQGSGSLPQIQLGALGDDLTTGESPWADIFDGDERNALISTLPADLALTPMQSSLRLKHRPEAPAAGRRISQKWLTIGILTGAAIVGFFLGAATLLLLLG